MKIQPLHDRVLVQIQDREETTKSGIIIPDSAKDESILEGLVVACGQGRLTDDGKTLGLTVQKDHRVLLGKWAGNEFKLDGIEHRLVREEDILGIVE